MRRGLGACASIVLVGSTAHAARSETIGLHGGGLWAHRAGVSPSAYSTTTVEVGHSLAPHVALSTEIALAHRITLSEAALGTPGALAQLGQLSPGFLLSAVLPLGPLRLGAGAGFAYHIRWVDMAKGTAGLPIDGGHPGYGHVETLTLIDHPGLNGRAEVGWRTPWAFWLVSTGGIAYAVSKVVIVPREDPDALIGRRINLTAWSLTLGLRVDLPGVQR